MNKLSSLTNIEKLYTFSFQKFKKNFSLYKKFLKYLNLPLNNLKTIIIAGSTGKGTSAHLLASLLVSHNLKTGIFTSPHLISLTERIQINHKPIPIPLIEKYTDFFLKKTKKFNEINNLNYFPSFFEMLSLIAFKYFIDNKVDYAILEVGMGGRLDATNVTNPIINIITPVCIDHRKFLGNSKEKILKEKIEIIKPHSITISLLKEKNLNKIIGEKCKKKNSRLFILNKDFTIIKHKSNYYYQNKETKFEISLKNPLFLTNSLLQCLSGIIFSLQKLTRNPDIKKIEKIINTFSLPGRCDIKKYNKKVFIIDGGHNYLAAKNFVEFVTKQNLTGGLLIFTIMKDKEIYQVLNQLKKITNRIVITRVNYQREMEINKIKKVSKKFFKYIYIEKELENIFIKFNKKNKIYYIFGSFYLAGKFYELFLHWNKK